MLTKQITVTSSRGEEVFEVYLKKEPICIIVDDIEYFGPNYWEILKDLRLKFGREDKLILCAGARYDVAPSRMTLQMSNGLYAYKLTLGKQTSNSDIIDIFDEAPVSKIATVDKQKEFYRNWINSL